MQTFLPFEDYNDCAKCLDTKRLGKQRVEVLQILNALTNLHAKGWINHPATNMWRGYETELIRYGVAICDEWIQRGFNDTVREKLLDRLTDLPASATPPWIGDERVHSTHRANLLRKDEAHYRPLGWTEDSETPYFWPEASQNRRAC